MNLRLLGQPLLQIYGSADQGKSWEYNGIQNLTVKLMDEAVFKFAKTRLVRLCD